MSLLDTTKFTIIAGKEVVEAMVAEKRARCEWTGYGYNSDQLCQVQREQASRGILGVEIICSLYGYSVRYDSGLQNFGLVASSHSLGGTIEAAERFAKEWVAQDPTRRYAWKRV